LSTTIPSPANSPSAGPGEGEGEGAWSSVQDERRTYIVPAILLGKLAVLLVVFLAYELLPFSTPNFEINFVDPARRVVSLATAFSTWDAQHYLYLSESGYHAGQMSNAFFPLLPLLIHLTAPIFHSTLVAGLVVSNVASLLGVYFLYRLVSELHGRGAADSTLLLYLAFPTAFFFSLIYTESLFLLLAASFFYLLFRRGLAWAALPAAVLPLARPEGVLIIIPFAVHYAFEVLGLGRRPLAAALARFEASQAALVLSPLLGAAAYLAYMRAATGNAFEMFEAMKNYVSAHSLTYVLHPADLARALGEWPLALHGFTNSAIDRALFLVFLLLLPPMFRRVHPALAVFGVGVGLLNVLSGTFMSYSRYLLLAFPVFITAGLLLQGSRLRRLTVPLVCSLALIQGLFLVMYALSYWVA